MLWSISALFSRGGPQAARGLGPSRAAALRLERLEERSVPSIASFDPSSATWYLRNEAGAGSPDVPPFPYGGAGWAAVLGDWTGQGLDTVGVVDTTGRSDPNALVWYLRDSNSAGPADTVIAYGAAGWVPVVGDWDGSGKTGVGAFDPATATWYLRTTDGSGPSTLVFQYGAPGWVPVVGDWGGTGKTTVGVVDPATMTWYLRNDNSAGPADAGVFSFGSPGWRPVTGNWSGTGTTTVGAVDPFGTWYLRDANGPGGPDRTFAYGQAGWQALGGTAGVGGALSSDPPSEVTRSVREFGAIGDGITDDTAAINQAIQAVSQAGGGTVLLPAGTYKVSIPVGSTFGGPAVILAPNVRLQGVVDLVGGVPAGQDAWHSTLKLADGQGDYSAILGPPDLWGDLSGFAIDGVAVDGNRQGNPASQALADTTDPNHKRYTLLAAGGNGISVTACKFFDLDCLGAVALVSGASRVTNARVANCLVQDLGGPVEHDSSMIEVRGDNTVIENNRVVGDITQRGCMQAYEVEGSNDVLRHNYAEQFAFGCQMVGDGPEGNAQVCDGNTFSNVLIGFMMWPFEPYPNAPYVQGIRFLNNTITVNRRAWVAGTLARPGADYFHGAIDVLVLSHDPITGADGGTINGLVFRNNTFHFTDPYISYPGEEPESAIRMIRTYDAQHEVTINGLVIQGNTVTHPTGPDIDPAYASATYVIGPGVNTPGAVFG
jgi:hypothetical protein